MRFLPRLPNASLRCRQRSSREISALAAPVLINRCLARLPHASPALITFSLSCCWLLFILQNGFSVFLFSNSSIRSQKITATSLLAFFVPSRTIGKTTTLNYINRMLAAFLWWDSPSNCQSLINVFREWRIVELWCCPRCFSQLSLFWIYLHHSRCNCGIT